MNNPLSTKIKNNPLLSSFNEFVLFINVTKIRDSWWLKNYNSTNTIEIKEYPPNLTAINTDGGCWGIRGSLTLPASVSILGGTYPFGNTNSSLNELIMKGSTPPTISGTLYIPAKLKYIYVPDDAVEVYKTASKWSAHASKIRCISEYPIM